MMRGAVCIAAALMAGGAMAKTGTPGPDYFVGSYDIVGQTAGAEFISGLARVDVQGSGLRVSQCKAKDLVLSFGPAFEVVNLLSGSQNGDTVACLFHNNGYNRPILTCRSDGGAAFTLWPRAGDAPACAP